MATRRQILRQKLIDAGFLPSEATTLSGGYTNNQFRTISYLQKLVRTRRLYVANLKSRGYADSLITQYIKDLYINSGWLSNGKRDVWKMIKEYRQRDIESGEYPESKYKGKHHGKGVSKGDVKGQRTRAKQKSFLQKYAEKKGRE
jgi:hypothetical protein